jgi:ADP-heptose:LPS heptosyltransferase
MRRILVIRYGGFGDIVLDMAVFRTIRAHHRADHVTALTTPPFGALLAASGYFDEVLLDRRLKPWRLAALLAQVRQLRRGRFDRVYDLQRNRRTGVLYRVIGAGRRVEWSGVVRGCSHFVADDPEDRRHILDRLAEQLAVAGISGLLPADLAWLKGDAARFALPRSYALLVPGGAPHRPEKRAPAEAFAALGRHLAEQGIVPVLIGAAAEREALARIAAGCPGAVDLGRRTTIADIADLARAALAAIGNDTGAMQLAAAVGCPSLVLFSAASDPRRIGPRGRRVEIFRKADLAALAGDELIAAWERLRGGGS